MIEKLTHFDGNGQAVMVDVTAKNETERTAIAKGRIRVSPDTMTAIREGSAAKGDVLGVARVAGDHGGQAHERPDSHVPSADDWQDLDCFRILEESCEIECLCTAKLKGQTGVEMEALTGVSVALLTIYDMCKAIDKRMEIGGIHLAKKTGGKSGSFINDPEFEEARDD